MKNSLYVRTILLLAILILSISALQSTMMMALMGMNGNKLNQDCDPNTWEEFTSPCINKLKIMGSNSNLIDFYYNPHGWGLLCYDENEQLVNNVWRNIETHAGQDYDYASASQGFDHAVDELQAMKPRIVMGHVRTGPTLLTRIEDPHPFVVRLNGKDYSFMHCGSVDFGSIASLNCGGWYSQWLSNHPEYPIHVYNTNQMVDSELYFYWIMKNIEDQNGDVQKGLKIALRGLTNNTSHGNLNFILSDGVDLYAYRYRFDQDASQKPLAYFYDINNEKANHNYCGIMSVFPNEWIEGQSETSMIPNNIETHMLERDELVYISPTGNIVRLLNFATTQYSVDKYFHKRDFHAGYNWSGFPILPVAQGSSSVSITDPALINFISYYYSHGNIEAIIGKGNQTVYAGNNVWIPPDFQLTLQNMYKLKFDNDSPSIHTWTQPDGSYNQPKPIINNAYLNPPDAPIIDNVQADNKYWVSYTLLPTQTLRDAFGTSWDNVYSVEAENWFYRIPPQDPRKDESQYSELYSYNTNGKNLEFGKGYIVKFKQNQGSFAWSRPYLIETPEPQSERPELFSWEDNPEYMVIDIAQAVDEDDIIEIGAFQGQECIGAVKPDKIPCQILVYPKYDNFEPITFSIIYKSQSKQNNMISYQVFNEKQNRFNFDTIFPAKDEMYIVKLTSDTPSQNISAINPLINLSSYPNPFNSFTQICFSTKYTTGVQIDVFNVKGQSVKSFGEKSYKKGLNQINWDCKDNNNQAVSNGIYFVQAKSGRDVLTHKIVLIKK